MIRLGITLGDASGIGPEISLRFLANLHRTSTYPIKEIKRLIEKQVLSLKIFGPEKIAGDLIDRLGAPLRFSQRQNARTIEHTKNAGLFIRWMEVDYPLPSLFQRGRVLSPSGIHALESLDRAIEEIKEDRIDALVTGPIHKEAIALSRKDFVGHTEYLGEAFRVSTTMCFVSPVFHLALMTTHVSIAKLPRQMTSDTIRRTIRSALTLQRLNEDHKPLLVLGFNPHAGEKGRFGKEDQRIEKVLTEFTQRGKRITGPVSADSAFQRVIKGDFTTVVACYHDQGLIPLKLLARGRSVNVTIGLPFIRTSVDHGTAFDIADRFCADWEPTAWAILTAYRLAAKVKNSKETFFIVD